MLLWAGVGKRGRVGFREEHHVGSVQLIPGRNDGINELAGPAVIALDLAGLFVGLEGSEFARRDVEVLLAVSIPIRPEEHSKRFYQPAASRWDEHRASLAGSGQRSSGSRTERAFKAHHAIRSGET